jgi:hypothetical protein
VTRNIFILILALGMAAARMAQAQQTNSAAAAAPQTGFESFQIISQKNIFDPFRRPRVGSTTAPPPTYYFTLTGTMSYEDKSYAFFDGTGISGGRAFQPAETINGYKIAEIANNYVKLMASSNQFLKLSVGMQMKRTGTGPWALVERPDLTAEPASSSSEVGSDHAVMPMVGGADSDVMKRLMARRAQETGDSKSNSNSTPNENNQ